ncbi:MAG: hypothetical protein JXR56_05335 [Candidatus Cloacimonetes bacterium]|nr:hypothetical protein [Candidatus Cloacimonadota bacterium]
MADKSVWFETVKHYINVLVAMILIFGVATGLYMGWYQSRAGKMIWVSNSYHLASSYHCASAKEHYMRMFYGFKMKLAKEQNCPLANDADPLKDALNSQEKANGDIAMLVLLQTIHQDKNFQSETDLIKDQFNSMIVSDKMTDKMINDVLESIPMYVESLENLQKAHFLKHQEMERQVKNWRRRRAMYFISFIAIMVLIGFGLVKRITTLIKMILFRLLEENDEREVERKLLQTKEKELDDLRSIIQRLKQEYPEIKI